MSKKQYGIWGNLKTITEGGQNYVYEATDTSGAVSGTHVLKRPRKPARYDRFRNEVKARLDLEHPNIVRIVDHDLDYDPPYLVEEYYQDGNLEDNIEEIRPNLVQTLRLFLQVCEAVSAAHCNRPAIIHRDIKPANILYRKSSGSAHLTDFGLCYHPEQERATVQREQVGSRFFICPEMEMGQQVIPTTACDVYSLGNLLYWMLSGKYLFRENHRTREYDLLKSTGNRHYERINRILDRCVVEQPQQRFASARPLVRAVREVITLVEQKKNVIRFGIYQKCIYCGLGNYEQVIDWDPAKSEEPNYYIGRKANFATYGYRLEPRTKKKWHVAACDYCGHVILFVRSPNNNSWEDSNFLPEERDLD